MDRDELLKRVRNPKMIPGIYSYCDRWCERCGFTDRCANASVDLHESASLKNEQFMETLHQSLAGAFELLQEIAAEKGINLDLTEEEERAYALEEKARKRAIRESLVVKMADGYDKASRKFLQEHVSMLEQKEEEWNEQLRLGIDAEGLQEVAGKVKDALEVIQWYTTFIQAKVTRAVSGSLRNKDMPIEEGDQSDSDGSAKVALVSIDRSMAAWAVLLEVFPEEIDGLITLLARLEKLKRQVVREFPKAPAFRRPGFDD